MNLLLRQMWALIRKNLLIICARRPISTFIRAIAIPLVVVLVVAYSKNFFASPQTWGVSSPHHLRSFREGLDAANGRNIVGFVDNGMKGGEVSSVIESLSQQIRDAGKTPQIYENDWDLAKACKIDTSGVSQCYGAVVFHSSPTEGTNLSDKGYWNYTLRGEGTMYGGFADVTNDRNGPEVYLLPLQRALDQEIISRSMTSNTSALPKNMEVIVYTNQDQGALDDSRTSNYLTMAIYIFGPVFAFTMVGIVYHMTSFVARERELGMSSLIDTMIPGGSNIRGRLARQIATYASFAIIYFPSWLFVGIVISLVVFPEKSRGIPVAYHICSGLAFTSFSLFGASFFKKAQLSGSIMVVIALVFAILPAVLIEQSKIACGILSFLFPSSNYTYFLTGLATFEKADVPLSMMQNARTDEYEPDTWRLELFYHWIFVVIQIIVYPLLAFCVEHVRFSTASSNRKFALPGQAGDPTVTLSGFCKTYHPGILSRIFKRRKDVKAVVDMDLKAYPGQILCLLGPNGSGKSTTLNCISGDQKVTSGSIAIDPTGGLGYAPQNNVIWPELTVEEHIRIFSDLKCITEVNDEIVNELVTGVDLHKKLASKAKTLSGGQKRKLQLAMMFAGGSAVCCVDEVSTGLDPISRRRIWEILLAERSRRTIIMTTHFLDEADFLADTIAIMYKGTLRAEGTPATLKSKYGNGYTIKLANHMDLDIQLSGPYEKEDTRHQMVYRVETAALAAELSEFLESQKIEGYQVSGPTMEELFLKATGDTITDDSSSNHEVTEETKATKSAAIVNVSTDKYNLDEGRPISVYKQWWILLCKRFRIIRRRWIPYFVATAFAIVGAGVAPMLIKSYNYGMQCPIPSELVSDYTYRRDFGVDHYNLDYQSTFDDRYYFYGPASKIDMSRFDVMADTYSVNHTRSYSAESIFGYYNGSQVKEQLRLVDTYDEFKRAIKNDWANSTNRYGYITNNPYTYVKGGIWMGDETSEPTVLINVGQSDFNSQMMNFLNVMIGGVPISAAYYQFATTKLPQVYDFKPLMFIIYYGLIMACYPAFFILYPTNERISNVRSMQYSNGIRPVPLWLSHLAFDGIFVLVISAVATGLLSASTPVWHGLGLVFVVFFLYGIVCALLSYVISMFARGAVTAWFMMALGQVIFYFAYFGGLLGVQSVTPYQDLESVMNALYFGLGIVSPVVSLERTLLIGLDQFATHCNGHPDGSIFLYGGPILYLILQAIFLFGLLLWWDSGFVLPAFRRTRHPVHDPEGDEQYSSDLRAELKRLTSPNTQLRVESVTKKFGKNLAVDNVTFGVQTSEIFALLGPNGAGKSTVISMIRGDIKPSTSKSLIEIAGHSITSSPVSARSNLGVCPQFDSADVLTVRETLHFFAKTRGVANIEHNVSTVIAATGIEPWADQLAQKLSGGTKRKLSLAVALVGNPQVLVLDEPSSALDANAKRTMWRCLQSIGKGRAMVLTTHSMEEADALADRIGIVSSRMLALGPRDDLKKRAGDAFHIHLVSRSAPRTTPAELQAMKDWIYDTFPHAKISRETQGGQIRFEIPAEGYELVGLIRVLEASKGDLGVEFYSVGKATLDEVFENIVRRYGAQDDVDV